MRIFSKKIKFTNHDLSDISKAIKETQSAINSSEKSIILIGLLIEKLKNSGKSEILHEGSYLKLKDLEDIYKITLKGETAEIDTLITKINSSIKNLKDFSNDLKKRT